MTSRERLNRIFQGKLPDRPPVKIWGIRPGGKLLHPAYEPVYRMARERTDLMVNASSGFDIHWGQAAREIFEHKNRPTDSEEWIDVVTSVHTPEGRLQSIHRRSTVGKPGYQTEYLLKQPDDIKKVLSVPYRPFPFSTASFQEMEKKIGDRGVTHYSLPHAMHAVERLIGSESFAMWSIECRDLLLEVTGVFARRIRDQVNRVFDAGLCPTFGWVGPELCIPPLMSPQDFEDFVFAFDAPLIDLIHERGGSVWVHCHGKMGPVLERFADMGVDVLNPIEPPPMGDVTLSEAFARVGDRMGLEGNIETHDLMTGTHEEVTEIVREAIEAGVGYRHILCPCSGYMEWPDPDERFIQNFLIYIEEGVRCAEAHRY